MNSLASIYNFLSLSDLIATAGQPTEEQLVSIAHHGYQVVVNLALPTSDHALPNERTTVESHSMEYVEIPVVWENPTLQDLEHFFEVMEVHQTRKVFVHCVANKRVSVFMYLYRRLKGRFDETTMKGDLLKIWEPNDVWQQFIQQATTHYEV
ncbi:MAG: phosphatase [Symploca sp. SIO2C1]|nr:phosphatase [Symploca sp. SIO2C1]